MKWRWGVSPSVWVVFDDVWKSAGKPEKSSCPSGPRGYTQAVLCSHSWVQVPQMTYPVHQWFSGKISRCQRGAPGSIPGWCICFLHLPSEKVSNETRNKAFFHTTRMWRFAQVKTSTTICSFPPLTRIHYIHTHESGRRERWGEGIICPGARYHWSTQPYPQSNEVCTKPELTDRS